MGYLLNGRRIAEYGYFLIFPDTGDFGYIEHGQVHAYISDRRSEGSADPHFACAIAQDTRIPVRITDPHRRDAGIPG